MTKRSAFPKTIQVIRETPRNDDPYLAVLTDLSGAEDGVRIATYQLVQIGTMKVERSIM